jgi:hypothetical protein
MVGIGQGSCKSYHTATKLRGRTVTLPANGIWTLESHLATYADKFPEGRRFPRSTKENINAHLQKSFKHLQKFVPGASFDKVYNNRYTKEWTPPENGKAGQGCMGNLKPSSEEEMWIFNMMWVGKGSKPKPGTKFLASYKGKHVVVVGGYEVGPSSGKFLGGFQPEVFWYLGAKYGSSKITISALADQTVKPGPIQCQ